MQTYIIFSASLPNQPFKKFKFKLSSIEKGGNLIRFFKSKGNVVKHVAIAYKHESGREVIHKVSVVNWLLSGMLMPSLSGFKNS